MLPEAKIYFSQSELPTSFVNEQKMDAMFRQTLSPEKVGQIIIQTRTAKNIRSR
jgi:hypothetical protein